MAKLLYLVYYHFFLFLSCCFLPIAIIMYTKQEALDIRQTFWHKLESKTRRLPGQNGRPIKWIADRTGRTVQRLNELYSTKGQVGFVGTERVDGKIILPEGIQLLKMKA